jgi:hypothetical protein
MRDLESARKGSIFINLDVKGQLVGSGRVGEDYARWALWSIGCEGIKKNPHPFEPRFV